MPIKSLTEVKNPSLLFSFRYINRRVTHLKDISRFRNLTELDVNGNLLQQEVSELKQLPFLKRLNLAGNQIKEMWALPQALEVLNMSHNQLKKLDGDILKQLRNLNTIDVSNNGLEGLDGIQSCQRLKRLLARNNQIQNLQSCKDLNFLVEIDLENNPIDSYDQVLGLIHNKRDILVLNLKLSPLMVKIQSLEEFEAAAEQHMEGEQGTTLISDFKNLLKFLYNGAFYRSKRVYLRIRHQMQQIVKRSISNFSNDGSSSNDARHSANQNQAAQKNGGAFSPLHGSFPNSGTNPHRKMLPSQP